MRLRSRDHEDPELNVISLVDVVLLLLIFFMLSTKFVDESRIELQLPQASKEPAAGQKRDPIEVGVTRFGRVSRQRPDAHQHEPRDAVGRGGESGRRGARRAGHDPRRRARHASVGRDRDGRARPPRVSRHQHRDRERRPRHAGRGLKRRAPARMHASDRAPKAVLTSGAWQTYRRLLSYVRPHRQMFLLGVLGATLFAASMVSFAGFAQGIRRRHVRVRDPKHDRGIAAGADRLVRAARPRRLHPDVLHGSRRASRGEAPAHADLRAHDAAADRLLRPQFEQRAAVAADLQHRAGRPGRDGLGRGHGARGADDLRLDRLAVLPQCAPGADRDDDGSAGRVAGHDHQPQVPPLQPAHPGLDGRHHARRQGNARRAARSSRSTTRRAIRTRSSRPSTSTTAARTCAWC